MFILLGQLFAHGLYLSLEGMVFRLLACQVVARELELGVQAFRGKQVGVLQFVLRPHEVAGLDVSSFQ